MKSIFFLMLLIDLGIIKKLRYWIGSGKQLRIYFKSTGTGRKGRSEIVYHFNSHTLWIR